MQNTKKTIILVDDIKANADMGKLMLRPFYNIITAPSAVKMFEVLEKLIPDLILLDILMPGMTGLEAISQLKSDRRYASIPVIFLTAKGDVDSELEGFELGAVDYISKPFSAPLLLKRIEKELATIENKKNLKEAIRDVKNANEAKSKFIANISHEIRTPLNAVVGLSAVMLDTEGLSDTAAANLEKIYASGMTILSIVNDVLDISKMEAGKFEIVDSEYDTPSMINDVIVQNILKADEKSLEFVLNLDENMPVKLYGDSLRVKQILNNLLSNAIKYTNDGTVTLSIRCLRDEDTVWLIITVEDTGIGISEENLSTILSEYIQVNMEANRMIEGIGLGLPITQTLVEMMGGALNVKSEYGKGSTFTAEIQQKFVTDVTIDKETISNFSTFGYINRKIEQSMKIRRAQLPYAKVLVVDDVATNLEVAKGLMKPYKMQVDFATSGQQAINAIKKEAVKYDAIFMDHMMPVLDGIESTRLIREIGTDYAKSIPIIAFTANALIGNEQMFYDAGFQDFISKPIDIGRLDAILNRWVRDKSKEKIKLPQEDEQAERRGLPADKQHGAERRSVDRRSGVDRRLDEFDLQEGIKHLGGDEELFREILQSFIENIPLLIEKVRSPSEDDLTEYHVAVHGIKGACRTIVASELAKKAEELEKSAKAGDFNHIALNNESFVASLEKLVDRVGSLLERKGRGNSSSRKE